MTFLWPYINFILFLILLWRLGKGPAEDLAKKKSDKYKLLFEESSAAYKKAEGFLSVLKKRFHALEKELLQVKKQANESGEREAKRLREEAKKASEFLVGETKRTIELERLRVEELLKKELWEQTIQGVIGRLQVELTSAEQKALVARSLSSIKELKR